MLVELFGVVFPTTIVIWRKGVDICTPRVFVGHEIELSVIPPGIQTQVTLDILAYVQIISGDEPRNITHVDERKLLTIAQLLITAYGIALLVSPYVVGKETGKGFVVWSKHRKRVNETHVFAFVVGVLVLECAFYATERVNQAQIGGVIAQCLQIVIKRAACFNLIVGIDRWHGHHLDVLLAAIVHLDGAIALYYAHILCHDA